MIDETLQKTYSPLKLAEVGKSRQHEKENNITNVYSAYDDIIWLWKIK